MNPATGIQKLNVLTPAKRFLNELTFEISCTLFHFDESTVFISSSLIIFFVYAFCLCFVLGIYSSTLG